MLWELSRLVYQEEGLDIRVLVEPVTLPVLGRAERLGLTPGDYVVSFHHGSFSRGLWQGLAGGQVVDGDFVALPVGAGEDDVAADGHGIIRGSFQVKEAALGDVDATFQDGQARRWRIHPHGEGIVLLPWGEVHGGFSEWFTIQGVDPDAGRDGILFRVGATIAVGYA